MPEAQGKILSAGKQGRKRRERSGLGHKVEDPCPDISLAGDPQRNAAVGGFFQ